MNKTAPQPQGTVARFSQRIFASVFLPAISFCLTIHNLSAGNATWKVTPASGDWNTAANWTPATVPNGPADIATFAVSNTTDVSTSANTEVNSIAFNPGASAFAVSVGLATELTISGAGIVNNSGVAQELITPVDAAGNQGDIQFFNSATAGTGNVFTIAGSFTGYLGGYINFWDTTTAGDNTFTLGGGVSGVSAAGGRVGILGNSTAGDSTFIVEGGGSGAGTQAVIDFYDNGSAGNATITLNGSSFSDSVGGQAFFSVTSTAANATLIANGTQGGFAAGAIYFANKADGGRAQVELSGTGKLDLTLSELGGVTIGSLQGDGPVFLGSNNLIVGSNNLSTTFAGVISGTGRLAKIGTGRLTLTNANTYSAGTTVKRGSLFLTNATGSATGSGNVNVEGGTLGGTGGIAGSVNLGTGSGNGAILRPGQARTTVRNSLSIYKGLILNSDAAARFVINSNLGSIAGGVIANGVTINGATFAVSDLGSSTLPPGSLFTLISNTANTSIAGTFTNLPDGSTFVLGTNTFQVSYEGGSGHNLTLTVQ